MVRIAVIGQSHFGAEVYRALRSSGHTIVGVFTVPDDKNGRQDPLAESAAQDNTPVFKISRWKLPPKEGGHTLPEVLQTYKSTNPELNVLAFVTQFIPMDVLDYPKFHSIIYHPSLLPRHRGASAINWTLMSGDQKAGLTVFWADDGLDTGPILLQKETNVETDDTVDTLYMRFLFPEGVKALVEAVGLIAAGRAPRIPQPTEGATYDPIWKNRSLARIDWSLPAASLHNFIRGNDSVPGAWTLINDEEVTMYGSTLLIPESVRKRGEVCMPDGKTASVTDKGILIAGSDGESLLVTRLRLSNGRTIPASRFLGNGSEENLLSHGQAGDPDLTSARGVEIREGLRKAWQGILPGDVVVEDDCDFFQSGAGSMDVTRLLAIVQQTFDVKLRPEEVLENTSFGDFVALVYRRGLGESEGGASYDVVKLNANNMEISFPTQLFIDDRFVDASDGKVAPTVNPTTEEPICDVAQAGVADVNLAVAAAKQAFESGEWRRMNARDRGRLMYRLADLMEQHQDELATIESLDSGAVFTLALKTHVGMSIDTFRYFAGWADKIQGATIPINNARPNRNLCITRREPMGVVALVVPWNYPLMMLSWKMAAALAAGNTVVIKPAQVTPLTALKFAELVHLAGFPKGVINILPGSGTVCGNALASHPDVRKLGFTGSTEIGKVIMESAAKSNLKKVSLELGGKSPLIIFADSDLDKAVRQAMSAVFFNKGENCIAAGRLFVEDSIHDEFLARVVKELKVMKIGDPLDRNTAHGPQNHKAHLDKLLDYIERGKSEGAKLVYGGRRLERKGYFLEPTVFTDVQDGSYIATEESFGPIMIVSRFDGNVERVLQRANDTEFGLCAGVFTQDISKALRVSELLHAGTVFINTYNKTDVAAPFGGVKQSGFGKDLGQQALDEYLTTKTITIEY